MSMSRWLSCCGVALVLALPATAQEARDPYQWLEDVTGEKPLAWVKDRNAESVAELAKTPEFKAIDERLLKILDSKDKIPFVAKRGEFWMWW